MELEACTPLLFHKRSKPCSPPPLEFEPIYSIHRKMAHSTGETPQTEIEGCRTP